jgi:hypothetical protein
VIRHVAVFRWNEGVTGEHVAEVSAALDGLPSQIPAIRSYTHGPNVQPADFRWDYAVVADFDDLDGWRSYDEAPAHVAVRDDLIVPLAAERTNLQLDVG